MSAERRAHWAQKLSESRSALFELLDSLSPEQWQTPRLYGRGHLDGWRRSRPSSGK